MFFSSLQFIDKFLQISINKVTTIRSVVVIPMGKAGRSETAATEIEWSFTLKAIYMVTVIILLLNQSTVGASPCWEHFVEFLYFCNCFVNIALSFMPFFLAIQAKEFHIERTPFILTLHKFRDSFIFIHEFKVSTGNMLKYFVFFIVLEAFQ